MIDKTPLQLNDDFKFALDTLEKSQRSLFITGRAGTGKSTLLQLFRNTTKKKIIVLAPTGVSALNVQGQTIHSFFGFPPRIITPQESGRKTSMKHLVRLYKMMEVLVIDEISMVRADMLDGIDLFLRVNRENNQPFGGVQLIAIGDLFQLPPIVNRDPIEQDFFQNFYETPYFFSAKVFKEATFDMEMLELRKVYRQESRHFLRLLEAVRINELDQDDLEDLNERYLPEFDTLESGYITLCARNATADRINRTELDKLIDREYTFEAEVKGIFDPALYPTEAELRLRIGAQVMFVRNDPDKAFVNGTIGKIIKMDENSIQIQVRGNDENTKNIDVPKIEWEIKKYKTSITGEIEMETIGSFRQYPLKLAWAITIHKSQGKTFDRLILDLGAGAFEHGQLYVALSRCRTLEGIVLKNKIKQSDVITDERVVDFHYRAFR
jgi:ATP-dependent DNA helicase PIF1